MRKLLVFQHVASEPLGHLDPLLREAGFRIRYVNLDASRTPSPTCGATTGWWCSAGR